MGFIQQKERKFKTQACKRIWNPFTFVRFYLQITDPILVCRKKGLLYTFVGE